MKTTPPTDSIVRPVVIGITGGIGSGKSSVSTIFRRSGFTVFDADSITHDLLNNDESVRRKLAESFGREIIPAVGEIDRKKLAELVFGSTKGHETNRRTLESIVHPRVLDTIVRHIEDCADNNISPVFVEIPLLYEIGIEDAFDYVIVVDAPDDIRIARTIERSGLPESAVRARMNEQMPSQEKRQAADFVIENGGSEADLERAVAMLAALAPHLPPTEAEDAPWFISNSEQ